MKKINIQSPIYHNNINMYDYLMYFFNLEVFYRFRKDCQFQRGIFEKPGSNFDKS